MTVPTPPSVTDYYKTEYTYSAGGTKYHVNSYTPEQEGGTHIQLTLHTQATTSAYTATQEVTLQKLLMLTEMFIMKLQLKEVLKLTAFMKKMLQMTLQSTKPQVKQAVQVNIAHIQTALQLQNSTWM